MPDTVTPESPRAVPPVEIKGTVLTATTLLLRSSDLGAIRSVVEARIRQAASFFQDAPVVLDFSGMPEDGGIDLPALVGMLRRLSLVPVGVIGFPQAQESVALSLGLGILQGGPSRDLGLPAAAPSGSAAEPESRPAATEERPVPAAAEPAPARPAPVPNAPAQPAPVATSTVVTQPVRSGQRIYAQGGDLVLLAPVNVGAEVFADGSIHVYGPLRGRAVAGIKGNAQARVFATHFEPELVSIAGTYKVMEEGVPPEVRGKPAMAFLEEDRLVFQPMKI